MDTRIIAGEFKRIFEVKRAGGNTRARGRDTGRLDPNRVGRLIQGRGDVFTQRVRDEQSEVKGSLAIACSLQDLYIYHLCPYNAGIQAWMNTVKALFEAGKSVGLEVRIIAANAKQSGGLSNDLDIREFDTLEAFEQCKGINTWCRHQEAVERAVEWHKEINPNGQRLTLLVSNLPGMRNHKDNRERGRFDSFIKDTQEACPGWSKEVKFFVLGCMLEKLVDTGIWGLQLEYGPKKLFNDLYPSSVKFNIDEEAEVPGILKALSRKMAHA